MTQMIKSRRTISKKDPDMLPRVVANLSMLLQDSSVQVQKRVIQAASQVYRCTLGWLAKARSVTEEMEATWSMIGSIKAQIVNLVDSDNDGIRTQSVKFLECIVLMQTYPEKDSMRRENDFSLEDVPLTLKIARRRKLEEEAHMVFDLLLQFHGSQHISSVNLMTCMGTITLIAKMRPQFMGKVIAALETLHTNLPPTLSKSQVSSVRKHLKMQLLNLLKLPSSVDYHNNITTLLTDLGATYQEVMKSYPKMEEVRRRQKRMSTTQHQVILGKKPRLDVELEEDEDEDEEEEEPIVEERPPGVHHTDMAIDVTEQYIVERLSPEMATQLVLVSMAKLPDTMPPHFSAMYTPIAAAGTHGQIKHVARLMATQWTASGLGPGAKQAKKLQGTIKPPLVAVEEEDDEIVAPSGKNSISTVISGMMDKEQEIMTNKVTAATLLPSGGSLKAVKQRIKTLKLSEITKPLDDDIKKEMLESAIKRILKSEKDALMGGVGPVRNKIITTLAATYNQKVREVVLNFLLEDLRSRIDLGFAWLYEEYSFMQGFNRMPAFLKHDHPSPDYNYNKLLCTLASNLIEKTDAKDRDLLLTRLYLEAPLITEEATDLLRNMCADESRAPVGLHLLMDLVIRRPPRQLIFLNALLVHTAHENSEVRSRAIQCVVELYDRGDLRCIIEEYAILYLSFLRLPQPPDVLFGADRGRPMKVEMWNEDIIKVCLYLYLALLPINEKLIHELARVYVQTVADVKRTILRLLEQPVRGMGMDSPQLLTLVEECPKGAETLVTRVIHILTDKTPPSAELVARVRDLYHTRVSDVRFLIPVLNGLTKKEVIAALPKLIKLNPVVVKEVFNRLLGTHAESMNHTSPLTPAELLIALHTIDPSKCELKTVIKATSMCFAEKQAYTQEVLAVVMQHLMELNPLPTLLMRTVIQSLSFYPRLIGFVMNILQRLILKQVWKQKKVWEGFIKCCQRTKPQSFQVLLQLPPAQLSDVFENSPDLRQPLLSHVMAFTENQRAHIPQSIMDVLLGNQRPLPEEYDVDMDQHSPVELTIDIKEEPEVEPAPPGMD
ncbi:symplekin isoform X2 [Anabrus simplex]|uniref:symplekin isoform X2 n=1 Tax=Anabrus simplex TaxID=316456 RepID=UPI0035A27AE0